VPDPKYDEELCVWIVPKRGVVLDAEGIRACCAGRIAHHKVPRVRMVKGFSTTVCGKVQKFAMREVMIEELNRDRSRG
jgi:fatty-acyl-CoA synthase